MPVAKRSLDILIGVNGIGMGHAVRQSIVAARLRDRGHRVRIVTNGATRVAFFREQGFPTWDGWMPTLIARGNRVHLRDALRANIKTAPAGFATHLGLRRAVRIDGVPDVFVTDYEPNSAYLAYYFHRPLVAIDQQSKYRLLDLPPVDEFTRRGDVQRLGLFEPRLSKSFICSFVPLEPPSSTVEIIPPIIPAKITRMRVSSEPVITAYFSRYFHHGPEASVRALAAMAPSLGGRTMRIYVQPDEFARLQRLAEPGVELRRFDRDAFIEDVARSEGVISNAGFNLISEAFALGKPMHVVPLPTYDQHWCARTIEQAGLGTAARAITQNSVHRFLQQVPELRQNVERHRRSFLVSDPVEQIVAYLESMPKTAPNRPTRRVA